MYSSAFLEQYIIIIGAQFLYGLKSNISFFSSRHFTNPSSFCQKEKRVSEICRTFCPLESKACPISIFSFMQFLALPVFNFLFPSIHDSNLSQLLSSSPSEDLMSCLQGWRSPRTLLAVFVDDCSAVDFVMYCTLVFARLCISLPLDCTLHPGLLFVGFEASTILKALYYKYKLDTKVNFKGEL